MGVAETSGKVCAACGADVNGKPRVKDAAGRYRCKGACELKPAVMGGATAKAASGPDDLLAKLIDSSPIAKATPCPQCASPLMPGHVVCTQCGFNTVTNKKLKTAITKEKEVKEKKRSGESGSFGENLSFSTLLLAFSGITVGIAALGFLHPMLVIGGVIVLGVIGFISNILTLASGIREGSVLMVILFTPIYGLFMDPNKWSRSLYIAATLGGFAWIAVVVLNFGGIEGLERAVE